MSRPDSPLRNNLTDDETIRKLKAMLIKEKRINKENSKIIGDLNNTVEAKSKENEQLISQIQRLSENIGLSQTEMLSLNKQLEEKDDKLLTSKKHLDLIYDRLKLPNINHDEYQLEDATILLLNGIASQLDNYKIYKNIGEQLETLKKDHDEILSKLNYFKINICQNFNDVLQTTNSSLSPKVLLNDNDELDKISSDIIGNLKDLALSLINQTETNSVLQDGFDKIVFKCNDLESTIESQNENVASLQILNKRLNEVPMELEQKNEQIRRLEELIEDNRNIARALETERDQLQNDLVDLRQRHEEKEGYLMEEYREAKQNLESYRVFKDNEMSCKMNEIEGLRKLLSKCGPETSSERLINECRFCREFAQLSRALKDRFEIEDDSFSQDHVVGKIVKKFENLENIFQKQIEGFQENEKEYRNSVEKIEKRIRIIEERESKVHKELQETIISNKERIDSLNRHLEEKNKIFHETNRKLLNMEESRLNLMKENEYLNGLIYEISELFNVDHSKANPSSIIDQLKHWIMKERELKVHKEQHETNIDDQINSLNGSIEERNEIDSETIRHITELEESRLNLMKENENLNEVISIFRNQIEKFQENEKEYRNSVENIEERIRTVEERESKLLKELQETIISNKERIDSLNDSLDQKNASFGETTRKLLELEESKLNLIEANKDLNEIIKKIRELFNIDHDIVDPSSIIDQLKHWIIEANELKIRKDLQETSNSDKERIDLLTGSVEERNRVIDEAKLRLLELEESQLNLLKENGDLTRVINEIGELFKINLNKTNSSLIIDQLKHRIIEERELNIDKELQETHTHDKEQIDSLNDSLEERNRYVSALEESRLSLLKENEDLTGIVNEIRQLLSSNSSTVNPASIIDIVKNSMSDFENLSREIVEYKSLLEHQEERLRNFQIENESLTTKLSQSENHSSGSDLMNLEMAEIDKTLINLNNQLMLKTSQVDDLEVTLKTKEQIINSFNDQLIDKEKQNTFLEERNYKMKQLLVKTKRELTDSKIELDQLKISSTNNHDRVESVINQLEENKFLLSEALKEKEKLIDHYGTVSKKLETISKNKDMRLADLRSQLDSTLSNHQSLQREFESYKIKAQNALSTQQRPKPTFSNFMTTESTESKHLEDADKKDLKKLVADLELIIKDLKLEIQEADDKNFSLNHELDNLRWENDKLVDKYKVLMKENSDINIKLQQVVQESQEIDKIQKNSYSSLIERFEIEKDNIVSTYLHQIETSKFNYETEISNLEQRLADIETEKLKYQEEIWCCREQLRNAEQKLSRINLSPDNSVPSIKYQSWPNNFKNPIEHERQQGEGMENVGSEIDDVDNLSNQHLSPRVSMKTRSYNNALVPLDKLLNAVDDDSTRLLEEQLALATTQSQASKKKVEHLSELLHDSEATVGRLTEQATILKSEIRRLEKNIERDSKLTDEPTHEYLKNVIMKFLDYETKFDERGHLVPVLVTLLSLDLNEKEKLMAFSKLIQFDRRQNVEGWSSYFNWTGIP